MVNYFKKSTLVIAAMLSTSLLQANNFGPISLMEGHRFDRTMFAAMTMPEYESGNLFGVKNFSDNPLYYSGFNTRGAAEKPAFSQDNLPDYEQVRTPNGMYFVTTSYDYEYIEKSEFYTEKNIIGYTFTFYDSNFNIAGTIKDKITYNKDNSETGTAHCVLCPYVTKNFFNDDDDLEVIIYLGIKRIDQDDMSTWNNHPSFYEKVYTLGAEKNANGLDNCIYTFTGRLADMITTTGNDADALLTFVDDEYFTKDNCPGEYGPQGPTQTDIANNTLTHIYIYGKNAENPAEPKLVHQRDIKMASYSGDTTESIYVMSKNVNGDPYFIFHNYEKVYFQDPIGGTTNEFATHDNNLLIEVYNAKGNNFTKVSETKIPVELGENGTQLLYYFYSIGSLLGSNDVDMTVNGTPEKPAFILATTIAEAANLDDAKTSYSIIDTDGKRIKNILEETASFSVLNQAGGPEPHVMFISVDENDEVTFDFVDIYSGTITMSVPQMYEGQGLLATVDRIKGDDGKYKYAFAMREYRVDDEYNVYQRVAWFDQDGILDHIDEACIGKDVQTSIINLNAFSMNPYLYDNDEGMEYAILVKRTFGNTVRNEFVITDDSGNPYAIFSADDGRGDPLTFMPTDDKLYIIYDGGRGVNIDVYNLPFENTLGVDSIIDEATGETWFGQGAFNAPGAYIEIYTTTGLKVAAANDFVATDALPAGIYVAVIKDVNGKTSTIKFAK